MATLQDTAVDTTDPTKKKPIPIVGQYQSGYQDPNQPNDTGSVVAGRGDNAPGTDMTDGGTGVDTRNQDPAVKANPEDFANGATPTVPPPRDFSAAANQPTDTGGQTPADMTQLAAPVDPVAPSPPSSPGIPSVGDAFGPGNDLRYSTVAPTDSARLTATQADVDATRAAVAGYDPRTTMADLTKQYGDQLATPDVGFNGVNTAVSRAAVNPNIAFEGVNTDVGAGPAIDPMDSAALAKYKAAQMSAADAVGGGASRQSIAQKTLDAFDAQAQPGIRDQIRSVGQRAAALGRIGNGQTAIEALNPYTDYLTNRSALETKLAADTASGDIQDRLDKLNATSGLVGQTSGLDQAGRAEQRTERSNVQDTSAANLARQVAERNAKLTNASGNRSAAQQEADAQAAIATGNAGRAMDERNARVSNAQTNASRNAAAKAAAISAGQSGADFLGAIGRARLASLTGVEGQQSAQEAGKRGETRTERGYQSDVSRQAIQDAINKHLIETGDQQQQFGNNLAMAGVGAGGNPAGAYGAAAGNAGANAGKDYSGLMQLLSQYYGNNPPQRRAA